MQVPGTKRTGEMAEHLNYYCNNLCNVLFWPRAPSSRKCRRDVISMRMKLIEVDDEVFEELQLLAEPLVDDANSVLRRVLGVAGNEPGTTAASRPPTSPPARPGPGAVDSPATKPRPSARHDQNSMNRRKAKFERVAGRAISDVAQIFKDRPDALQSLVRSLDGERIKWTDDLPRLSGDRQPLEGLEWHEVVIWGVQTHALSVWDDQVRTDVVGYWPWTDGAARAFGQGSLGRARRGSLLRQAAYEMPILESLIELGGSAPSSVVVDRVGEKLEAQFTGIDRDKTSGKGVTRWRNRTQFARLGLVEKGQMLRDSPHGVWEISDAGRDRVKGEVTT